MRPRAVLPLALAVVSGSFGLVACGSEDDEPPARSAALATTTGPTTTTTTTRPTTTTTGPTTTTTRPTTTTTRPTTTTTAGPPPARPATTDAHDAFVGRLNAVCRSGNAAIGRVNAAARASGSVAAAAPHYAEGARLYVALVASVRSLEAPPEDEDAFAELVRAGARTARLVKRLADAAGSGRATTPIVAALRTESAARRSAAVDLGADECGQTAE